MPPAPPCGAKAPSRLWRVPWASPEVGRISSGVPPAPPCGPHSRACPGGRTCCSCRPPHRTRVLWGPRRFYLLGRNESARHQGFACGKTLGVEALQSGLQLGLAILIAGLAQEGVHVVLVGRPTEPGFYGDPGDFICSGGMNPPGIKVLPAAKRLVWRPYNLASSSALRSS